LGVPFRNVLDGVTIFGGVVENFSKGAAAAAGNLTIDAHVEVLAILGVCVPGVDGHASFVGLRAVEVEDICKKWSVL
jgi:hypothetical protein